MIDAIQGSRSCPLCGNGFLTAVFYPPLVRCGGCGLVFRNRERARELIREEHETRHSDVGLEPWVQDRRRTLYREFLTKYRPVPGRNRLLDVGCGTGQFLKLARAQGWDVMGVEIAEADAESARGMGLPVVVGPLENSALPEPSFDVVTLWNVLDFAPDPVEQVSAVKQVLAPGGTLVVRVPNLAFQSAVFRLSSVFPCWPPLVNLLRKYYIFHQLSFNARTLRRTLEQGGFEQIQITNSLPSYGDPYQTLRRSGDGVLQAVKRSVYGLAWLIAVSSGGKVLVGSSLLATAVKGDLPLSGGVEQLVRQGEGAHR
ncbi:MAG: class I SAM-dependent methyltransferase [Anaerolineae bacterium]